MLFNHLQSFITVGQGSAPLSNPFQGVFFSHGQQCGTCGQAGHNSTTCPQRSTPRQPPQCGTCGQAGHNSRTCPGMAGEAMPEAVTVTITFEVAIEGIPAGWGIQQELPITLPVAELGRIIKDKAFTEHGFALELWEMIPLSITLNGRSDVGGAIGAYCQGTTEVSVMVWCVDWNLLSILQQSNQPCSCHSAMSWSTEDCWAEDTTSSTASGSGWTGSTLTVVLTSGTTRHHHHLLPPWYVHPVSLQCNCTATTLTVIIAMYCMLIMFLVCTDCCVRGRRG